ncbi:HNH endonuclease [Arthrobacter phage Adolin]|uniref:HNH endonuclease n=1 Tax=Arthrobacter phage Adolin TaxID=2686213 RepID=A0A6B9LG59_9CAUD|nr:HNH endonuclease [Arthrobacter phage Adolin]
MKQCSKCLEDKPLDAFHKAANSKTGRQSQCKDCKREASRAWALANPEKVKASRRRTWAKHGKGRQYQKLYGLTADEVEQLAVAQEHKCAICRLPADESPYGLCVDHDHATGEVRGLLCFKCNTALGKLGDSTELLYAAIRYLERGTDGPSRANPPEA